MSDAPPGPTKQQLLKAVEGKYEVTAWQLARWHRYGLLLPPTQVSLGKGHGSQSVYPAGTEEQLFALCKIHFDEGEKRFPYIAWRLWWAGFDVRLDALRGALLPLAEGWEEWARARTNSATGQLSKMAWDEVNKSRTKPPKGKFVSLARSRVGKRNFPTLMRILIEIFTGTFVHHEWTDGMASGDVGGALTEQLLGLPGVTSVDWREISRRLHRYSPVQMVSEATYQELVQIRKEVQWALGLVTMGLAGVGQQGEELLGMLGSPSPDNYAVIVLFWPQLRPWLLEGFQGELPSGK